MRPEKRFVDVSGRRTQVTSGGSGPPLVYLHSALGEAEWLDFHERLAARFTVHVPAQPGFADSEGYEDVRDMEDLAFHLDDLYTALEAERPAVVGQSLGGWAAIEHAVRWPDRVSRLVLVDAVGLRVAGAPVPDMWMTRPPELADLMFSNPDHPLALLMKAFQPDSPPPAEVLVPFFKNQQATARLGWNPYLHDPKLPGRLHRATAPVLVLWGADDGFVPVAHGERYVELLPDARLERIEGAGHLPVIERPDETAARILDFLSA